MQRMVRHHCHTNLSVQKSKVSGQEERSQKEKPQSTPSGVATASCLARWAAGLLARWSAPADRSRHHRRPRMRSVLAPSERASTAVRHSGLNTESDLDTTKSTADFAT